MGWCPSKTFRTNVYSPKLRVVISQSIISSIIFCLNLLAQKCDSEIFWEYSILVLCGVLGMIVAGVLRKEFLIRNSLLGGWDWNTPSMIKIWSLRVGSQWKTSPWNLGVLTQDDKLERQGRISTVGLSRGQCLWYLLDCHLGLRCDGPWEIEVIAASQEIEKGSLVLSHDLQQGMNPIDSPTELVVGPWIVLDGELLGYDSPDKKIIIKIQ